MRILFLYYNKYNRFIVLITVLITKIFFLKNRLQKCWRELGSLGLLGITIPTEFEGTGGSYTDHVIAMEEISRASGSVGLSYVANTNLCMNQIRLNGTQEQKMKYLPRVRTINHLKLD